MEEGADLKSKPPTFARLDKNTMAQIPFEMVGPPRAFRWLFDKGMISITDDYQVLRVDKAVPDQLKRLLLP